MVLILTLTCKTKERFIMMNTLVFLLLAVLGLIAMGYVYYLCEIDTSFEDENRKKISVISNNSLNNNSNDVA